jgi:hypothetical protein
MEANLRNCLMVKKILGVCACLCLAAGTLQAQNEDRPLVDTARKTLQTYDKAVVSVAAVLKIEVGGSEQERKTQCVASIIDPCGLAVTSLTNLNPQSLLKARFSRAGGSQIPEFDCQVQEVKYRLTDGTEVPARIVLKDEELDLAFLAPLKPLDEPTQSKMAVIPMSDSAAQVDVLDAMIVVDRSGDGLNYVPTLTLGRIAAVLSKPRVCYLSSAGTQGLPVFDREGKLMGIVCRCISAEGGDVSDFVTRLAATSRLILPAAEVAKLVPQAKEEMKKPADADKK